MKLPRNTSPPVTPFTPLRSFPSALFLKCVD